MPEDSPLMSWKPGAILVAGHPAAWTRLAYSQRRVDWISAALTDAAERASVHWNLTPTRANPVDLASVLTDWAGRERLDSILTLRPEVGPLDDEMPSLISSLASAGIPLIPVDRPEDVELRPLATRGFFHFWENLRPRLEKLCAAESQT